MWNPFKKPNAPSAVFAPVEGEIIELSSVPDPVFSGGMMGQGFAVQPTSGEFGSPVEGEIIMVARTLHAFGVRTDEGAEVLVHIGIDTVNLKGEGFTAHRRKGDRVRPGDVVVSLDLASVSGRVPSMATPVIVTNGDRFDVSAPDLGGSTTVKVAELSPKG